MMSTRAQRREAEKDWVKRVSDGDEMIIIHGESHFRLTVKGGYTFSSGERQTVAGASHVPNSDLILTMLMLTGDVKEITS